MATASKKEVTIADKLDALFALQQIDSEIDRIRTIRGELPLEVRDLEDEISGLETRLAKMNEELKEFQNDIAARKIATKDAEAAIAKYKERQNNVRNNREYESISKEIEYQELEIKLHDKRSKEAKANMDLKAVLLEEISAKLTTRKEDLAGKQEQLDAIISETQIEEEKLLVDSEKAKSHVEDRYLSSTWDFAFSESTKSFSSSICVSLMIASNCSCFPAKSSFRVVNFAEISSKRTAFKSILALASLLRLS